MIARAYGVLEGELFHMRLGDQAGAAQGFGVTTVETAPSGSLVLNDAAHRLRAMGRPKLAAFVDLEPEFLAQIEELELGNVADVIETTRAGCTPSC